MRNISSQTLQSKPRQRKLPFAFDFAPPIGDAGPDDACTAIEMLHRDPDAWLTFARKMPDGGVPDTCATQARHVLNLLPGILDECLGQNAYFSVNAFLAPRGRPPVPWFGGVRGVRTNKHATRLNAAFVDVDSPDPAVPMTPEQVTQVEFAVRAGVDAGEIPEPSFTGRSGCGVWFFWVLRDDDTAAGAPKSDTRTALAYDMIQGALQQRIARRIPALKTGALRGQLPKIDDHVRDRARLTRVPGTVNTAAGRVVSWWPVRGAKDGARPIYTLHELGAAVNAPEPPTYLEALIAPAVTDTDPPPRPQRRSPSLPGCGDRDGDGRFLDGNRIGVHGGGARWRSAWRNFEALRWRRGGGFGQGHREKAAFVLALILRRLYFTDSAIEDRVAVLGRQCSPPLDAREQAHAIATSKNYQQQTFTHRSGATLRSWGHRNAWFARALGVTPEEAEWLPTWPAATGARRRPGQKRRSREDVVKRRAEILSLIRALTFTPTQEVMRETLAARGFVTSQQNISDDYRALNIRSGSNRGRRAQPPLPLTGASASQPTAREDSQLSSSLHGGGRRDLRSLRPH